MVLVKRTGSERWTMADRFFVNTPLAPGEVELVGPEAHHLATVCRLRPGDAVCLFNGDGLEYAAEIVAVGRRSVTVRIHSIAAPQREHGFHIEVAAPLPKGDRAQFLLEKLTELGVASFVPLRTERSVVHPRDAKLDKLQRHVIEASKQCGRNVLLQLQPLTDWADYVRRADLPATRVVAHPSGHAELERRFPSGADVAMAVGPEGGFTDEEVALARHAGWQLVDLGPRILRVETAAIVLAVWASSADVSAWGAS
jgi:16S rRNA (uracil1498-N3)-methyltransferase